MIDQFKESFRDEAYELLNSLESSLLELETDPKNEGELSAVFRSMHTIKGSASMFGFQHISRFTHEVETVLDSVRNGTVPVTKQLITLTLAARDHIRFLLDNDEPESAGPESDSLIAQFHELAAPSGSGTIAGQETTPGEQSPDFGGDSGGVVKDAGAASDRESHRGIETTYRVRFSPPRDIYRNGTNPLMLLKEMSELGEFTSVAHVENIPDMDDLDPELCYLSWDIIVTTDKGINEIRDVFMFVDDVAEIRIDVVADIDALLDGVTKKIGEILLERGVVTADALRRAADRQQRLGRILVEDGLDPHELDSALKEQRHVQRVRDRVQNEVAATNVRVSAAKLDELVDLVGEIVTLQARLSQLVEHDTNADLKTVAEGFERATDDLRGSTMSMRMVPIGTTFSKFKRLVRDLSEELGKKVEIVTEGGETELDKTVIDRLNDPLVHIIRNSVGHGIESPEARKTAGKTETGTVRLSATHSGASVVISISDDGAGLSAERIRAKAISRSIITEDAQLTDKELYDLIFAPGFSTAENVTQVSGRGVGMDVVKQAIESLGGSVGVSSEPGIGARITLSIPLTLAIIDGLLVELGTGKYVFPLSAIEECIERTGSDSDARMISNRGELLPVVELRQVFAVNETPPEIEQIVVVRSAENTVGFAVDRVVGEHQTVIKSLGRVFRDLECVSGATILGDGSVALIVDVQRLTNLALQFETARR
ncbi:MAG: chemotaxis protein CheA [Spirochaetaceae bacterium]|nr:MAG: chemotaxis protein CheA [Spirochaetaceae bacterium]